VAAVKLLVTRFSSMGDVALVAPALRAVLAAHPEVEITLLTRALFTPFFTGMPRLKVVTADLKGTHHGLKGLRRLYRELAPEGFDALVDLHNVTRSQVLGWFFRLGGVPVVRLDKGRGEKRAYIAGKTRQPLRHTVQRYLETFAKYGLASEEVAGPYIQASTAALAEADETLRGLGLGAADQVIGIAPFAMHAQKMWPLEHTRELLSKLTARPRLKVLLFGGGAEETEKLAALAAEFPDTFSMAGQVGLEQELGLISRLQLMLSMDSSNMHLASLLGVPTFSIWGGTHPDLGFRAYGQDRAFEIQPTIELDCRPCSVYGARPCRFGQPPRCLESIPATEVAERLLAFLTSSSH
jgi:ADP-heptose:LPS heptosyltransferase